MTNILIADPKQRKKSKKTAKITDKGSTTTSSLEKIITNNKLPITYINKSKDGKWNVYKYTLPTDRNSFIPKDLIHFISISKIFL